MFGQDGVLCCQDLIESTLDKSYVVARSQFTPEALAVRLKERLRHLIRSQAAMGAVLEVPLEAEGICLAAGTWVFVDTETYGKLRVIPLGEFDGWFIDHVLRDGGGVLTHDQVAQANAGDGLNLFMLYFKADDAHVSVQGRTRVVHEMMSHIFPEFTGYNLRSLTARIRHRSQVASSLQAGCRLMRPDSVPSTPDGDFLPHPVLVHAEREWMDFASWIAGAFVWSKPRFKFTGAEQRTLILAMRGHRDLEIASMCQVSLSTLKKRWDSIFARIAVADPSFFGETTAAIPFAGHRGREKRRSLLAYVSDHPEELRPYAQP